jgi:hypothetical protein
MDARDARVLLVENGRIPRVRRPPLRFAMTA